AASVSSPGPRTLTRHINDSIVTRIASPRTSSSRLKHRWSDAEAGNIGEFRTTGGQHAETIGQASATSHADRPHLDQAQTSADVVVGCYDQVTQGLNVKFFAGAQLHMTHALALAFEQADGIREHCAIVETDIRMSLEGVDISKRRIPQTSHWASVVQKL